ncbi:hypothetical protein [Methylomicrobium sp. Wu6]|uniref:hypothetical protein n=1 Tax=Methylomicrobium sp. Wu6 TaxID=3107928 RepID=UPI002DD6A57B|nr:hypothetical protein [Methylomicrobium sp. Wu6]MEC4749357.1 hypothetical protein [Methylomicrobium sp. Wu6]
MNDTRWNPEKPAVIIAICVVGLINAIQMINLVFSPMSKQVGAIYPTYFAFSVLVSLICITGLWLLKRWAALAYSVLLIVNQIALMLMGYWEVTAAVIPFAIILLLFKHLDKMR